MCGGLGSEQLLVCVLLSIGKFTTQDLSLSSLDSNRCFRQIYFIVIYERSKWDFRLISLESRQSHLDSL